MDAGAPGGLVATLRGIAASVLDMVGTRAELALVELREEGERRKRMLFLVIAAAFFFGLAFVFAGAFIVVAFWDTHRLLALGGVTLAYLVAAALCALRLRTLVRASPPPFDETLRALAADRELLRPEP
jgi:uncharacterized membrane protein YqjE